MQHSASVRNIVITLASAYLLASTVLVATGHRPVCRFGDAVAARSAADRSSTQQDYPNAERLNVAALHLVSGCASGPAFVVGLTSVERAGAAFAQRQYYYVLSVLSAQGSALTSVAMGTAQKAQSTDPFRMLLPASTAPSASADSVANP